MKKFVLITLLIFSGLLGFGLSWHLHHDNEAERLAAGLGPGDIPITPTYHSPASFVKQLKGDPAAGRKIFKEFCVSCHGVDPIIDMHAPTIGDRKVWNSLRQLGIKNLLNITIKGAKAMPARGGCFECSDKQLRDTIEYILRESQ